ncbi:MAG: sigma-70 family RNA polymerase sigma factor [Planctomycetes bacterium]|nr:sigma-70 family RNA polymerase sigma factor [Planctomycetota bacterium]
MPGDPLAKTTLLLQRARSGDTGARERLFATFLPRVRRIVAARMGRTVRDLAEVDDMVQETMLDVFSNLEVRVPDSMGAFYLWLARCVENNIADCMRSGRALKRGAGNERRFADADSAVVRQITGGTASPATAAAAEELDERLEIALLALREDHRRVVVLRVLCDMTFAEIAAELGHDGTDLSRAWFSRAMAAMRRRLDGGGSPGAVAEP